MGGARRVAYAPLSSSIDDAAGCLVCHHLVANVLAEVQSYMNTNNKTSVDDYTVEHLLQNICDPFLQDGAWLRKIRFLVAPDEPNKEDDASQVHLEVVYVNDGYTECKRTCATVQQSCQFMIDYIFYDWFVKDVALYTQQGVVAPNRTVNEKLEESFCSQFILCSLQSRSFASVRERLNNPTTDVHDREDIEADTTVVVDSGAYAEQFPLSSSKARDFPGYTLEDVMALHDSLIALPKNVSSSEANLESRAVPLTAAATAGDFVACAADSHCFLFCFFFTWAFLRCACHVLWFIQTNSKLALSPLAGVILCGLCTNLSSLFVSLMMLVVLSGQLFCGNHQRLLAAAAPLAPKPFNTRVANSKGCALCYHVVTHALVETQAFMDHNNKSSVSPYEVEDVMEHLCNPDDVAGSWIRQIEYRIVTEQKPEEIPLHHIETRMLENITTCKRGCLTLREKCKFMTDYTNFDFFTKEVAKYSKKGHLLDREETEKELRETICHRFYPCIHKERILISLARELNSPKNTKVYDEVTGDTVEFLSEEEVNKLSAYGVFKNEALRKRLIEYRKVYADRLRDSMECHNDMRPDLSKVPAFRKEEMAKRLRDMEEEEEEEGDLLKSSCLFGTSAMKANDWFEGGDGRMVLCMGVADGGRSSLRWLLYLALFLCVGSVAVGLLHSWHLEKEPNREILVLPLPPSEARLIA
eukprot:gene6737-4831_t